MFQERRVAAIVRSTYEIDRGTQVIFLCRRNLAIDKKWPIFRDWNKTQCTGAVKEEMVLYRSCRKFNVQKVASIFCGEFLRMLTFRNDVN
jgi:hypothetical protein